MNYFVKNLLILFQRLMIWLLLVYKYLISIIYLLIYLLENQYKNKAATMIQLKRYLKQIENPESKKVFDTIQNHMDKIVETLAAKIRKEFNETETQTDITLEPFKLYDISEPSSISSLSQTSSMVSSKPSKSKPNIKSQVNQIAKSIIRRGSKATFTPMSRKGSKANMNPFSTNNSKALLKSMPRTGSKASISANIMQRRDSRAILDSSVKKKPLSAARRFNLKINPELSSQSAATPLLTPSTPYTDLSQSFNDYTYNTK